MRAVTRKRLNLDVDGVIADFAWSACDHLYDVTGRRYDPNIITTWEVFDSIPHELEHRKAVYDRMKATGGCYSIPVIPGSKEAIAELKELVDITVVTSPFKNSPTWMHEREQWLRDHFGIDRDDIFHGDKKYLVHAHMKLDDKESHIDNWEKYWRGLGQNPFGMLWHTNRNVSPAPHIKVVHDWPTVIQLVKTYIATNP